MSTQTSSRNLKIVLSFLAIYFIWGTTYFVIVLGLKGFPPFTMAAVRFLIAGLILAGYSLYKKEGLPSKSAMIKNSIIGLIVLAGGQGSLFWAEQYIPSGYASVLVATIPIWFVVLDRAHWNSYFKNPIILIGLVLGFVGIILLFSEKLSPLEGYQNKEMYFWGSVVALFGAMCWVAGTLYNRSRPAKGTIHANLGWQLIGGSIICLLLALVFGEAGDPRWFHPTFEAWLAVIYLATAGSVVAFVAYTWLLNELPSAVVGTYAYINPVVAVFIGWVVANEQLGQLQFIGMIVVLISAVLINLNRTKAIK
ncbi:MAG: drug/metabolite transporter (DMT)-like permease [Marinoscillum sp.]|jgi:drug/metabolite transporter (DMT)-like permease